LRISLLAAMNGADPPNSMARQLRHGGPGQGHVRSMQPSAGGVGGNRTRELS
jgi:hypothetical protein